MGGLRDVITCAEFQIEIFVGYDFTGGRIFDFPIDFSMGLTTVQRYCAACDDNGLYQDLNPSSTQLGALSYQAITKTCELKKKVCRILCVHLYGRSRSFDDIKIGTDQKPMRVSIIVFHFGAYLCM